MERNYLLDNARFAMMFLVVFGHGIEPFIDVSSISRVIYTSIYSYHMPVFVMISGWLAKSTLTKEYVIKIFYSLLIPFLVFNALYEITHIVFEGESSWYTRHYQPYWLMWFLISLLLWKLTLPFFLKLKYPVTVAFILSIAAGYELLEDAVFPFGLGRTLYFFPFFVFGYTLLPKILTDKRLLKLPAIIWLSLLAVNIFVFSIFWDMPYQWLYGNHSYESLGYSGMLAGLIRALIISLSFITALAVLFLLPRGKTWFSEKGANSLYIFVWHGLIIKTAIFLGLFGVFRESPDVVTLITVFLFSLALTLFLSGNAVALYTKRFLLTPINKGLSKLIKIPVPSGR